MPALSIKIEGLEKIQRRLGDISDKDMAFVTAYALTKSAQDIRAEERRVMESVFDRPTKFTLNALFVKPATKSDLQAVVYFKDGGGKRIPASRYLMPQVEGGRRSHKAFERRLIRQGIMRQDEYAVPGQGASLDAHGNMRGGDIERILSQLGAAEQWAGYQANTTSRSRARAVRRGGRYFVLRGTKAPDGIYHRTTGRDIMPVIMFVRQPQYAKLFPFYETGEQVFDRVFTGHVKEGFVRYVANSPRNEQVRVAI